MPSNGFHDSNLSPLAGLLWLEDTGDWGTIAGCGRCGISIGPWAEEADLIAWLAEHWRDEHGAAGGRLPRVVRFEDVACATPGCTRPRRATAPTCKPCYLVAHRAAKKAAAA